MIRDDEEIRVRTGWRNDVIEMFVHHPRARYRVTASKTNPGKLTVIKRDNSIGWSGKWVTVGYLNTVDEAINWAIARSHQEIEEAKVARAAALEEQQAFESAKAEVGRYTNGT